MTTTERSANALADLMLATMSATNKAIARKPCPECHSGSIAADGFCTNARCIGSCVKDKESV
jgi:hypothetical protein